MNGRTIYKRLMKNRLRVFWGPRAFFSVRVPLSVFPEPFPEWTPPGEPGGFAGYFRRQEGDKILFTTISKSYSGFDPRTRESDPKDAWRGEPHFVECDWRSEDGKSDSWSWWECYEMVGTLPEPSDEKQKARGYGEILEYRPGNPEMTRGYRAQREWLSRYVDGDCGDDYSGFSPLLQRLIDALLWCKTAYGHMQPDKTHVVYTYSVKWRYPNRRRGFAAAMHRVLKQARKDGVSLKVLKS